MTSTVLARKYRPKSFEGMVGQGHVVQALSNALTQQRLHHAYLFTGTRGVGKTTVSRILAKSLNCVGGDGLGTITASPCGQCQPCRDIDAGRFVDYVELDAASNRGVEDISQLLEQAVYKPVLGRFKVYMIDEVHMLSSTAFNAMLKTLEEPPEYLKFVLATTDPQKVPVTVLSRCLQFNLRPMAMQTMQAHLQQVLTTEGIAFDAGAVRLLSRAARGSMRDAMSLADQAIAFGGGGLEESAVRQMLGSVDRQHVQRLIEAVSANDGGALVAVVDTLRQLGLSASGTLEELATALQRMAVMQAAPQAMTDDVDPDAMTWQRLAPLLAPDETQLFYSLCLQGRAELALAPDEYSGLLMLLLRLLAFKPGVAAQAQGGVAHPKARGSAAPTEAVEPLGIKAQLGRPSSEAAHKHAADADGVPPPWETVLPSRDPGALMAPASTAAQPPLGTQVSDAPQPDPLSDRWAAVVHAMDSQGLIGALVRELAMQAQCVAESDAAGTSHWRLIVERESLRSDMNRARLEAALSQCLGKPVSLAIEAGVAADTPAQRDQRAREQRLLDAEALIRGDTLVTSLLSQYPSARIVPGSIRPI